MEKTSSRTQTTSISYKYNYSLFNFATSMILLLMKSELLATGWNLIAFRVKFVQNLKMYNFFFENLIFNVEIGGLITQDV